MSEHCHNCGHGGLRGFYEVRGVPVHSCLMLPSRAAALAYPKGDVRLAFCPGCGFIQNTAFDAGVHEYSTRYEETQAFSPRFRRFAEELCDRLLEDYQLRGKQVLEIGCGKGEWLVMLCERGGCHGIGVDPGYRPERTETEAASRLQFIQDFWSRKYAHLTGDLVACRHTLEHIQPTRDFVRLVRDSIGARPDTVVFFEVPDVLRVLEEQAFWDIYYEHCSYFSAVSLAHAFRACDFEVVEQWTDFDDQYLMLVAKPGARGSTSLPPANDLASLSASVDRFARDVPVKLAWWRDELARLTSQGRRPVVWGSGSKAVAWLTTLGVRDEIEYIVDINPFKHGMFLAGTGHEIVPPSLLADYRPDVVIVMNPIYSEEISRDCQKLGLDPELWPV